jgi:hypothetical protein
MATLVLVHQEQIAEPYTILSYPVLGEDFRFLAFYLQAIASPNWYKGAYLNTAIRSDSNDLIFVGKSISLPVNRYSILEIPLRNIESELIVTLVPYLRTAQLLIYKSDMPLFFESASQSASSTTVTTLNVTTSAQELILANPSRKGLTIRNKGSGSIFIGLTNSVSTTNYYVAIPANGVYEFSSSWVGSVWFIATANRQAEATEFV